MCPIIPSSIDALDVARSSRYWQLSSHSVACGSETRFAGKPLLARLVHSLFG